MATFLELILLLVEPLVFCAERSVSTGVAFLPWQVLQRPCHNRIPRRRNPTWFSWRMNRQDFKALGIGVTDLKNQDTIYGQQESTWASVACGIDLSEASQTLGDSVSDR